MKKFICAVLALVMVLSLAACGSKQDDNGGKTDVDLTAQEVLDKLKETLGDSYGCDAQDDEDRMTNYYGLDMSQVDSWASEASSMSALDPSTAVVLKVKDGYADTAADLLRECYQQVLDYSKMYNMNVPGGAGPSVRQRQLCGAADPGPDPRWRCDRRGGSPAGPGRGRQGG